MSDIRKWFYRGVFVGLVVMALGTSRESFASDWAVVGPCLSDQTRQKDG